MGRKLQKVSLAGRRLNHSAKAALGAMKTDMLQSHEHTVETIVISLPAGFEPTRVATPATCKH